MSIACLLFLVWEMDHCPILTHLAATRTSFPWTSKKLLSVLPFLRKGSPDYQLLFLLDSYQALSVNKDPFIELI